MVRADHRSKLGTLTYKSLETKIVHRLQNGEAEKSIKKLN